MVTDPKTLPVDATLGEVLDSFDDDHVHMVLLADGPILRGALERDDIPADRPGEPALGFASLTGRTVSPTTSALVALELLLARGSRRGAVVDADGRLLGLLCLKRRLTGFCSDADVAARAAERLGLGRSGGAATGCG